MTIEFLFSFNISNTTLKWFVSTPILKLSIVKILPAITIRGGTKKFAGGRGGGWCATMEKKN